MTDLLRKGDLLLLRHFDSKEGCWRVSLNGEKLSSARVYIDIVADGVRALPQRPCPTLIAASSVSFRCLCALFDFTLSLQFSLQACGPTAHSQRFLCRLSSLHHALHALYFAQDISPRSQSPRSSSSRNMQRQSSSNSLNVTSCIATTSEFHIVRLRSSLRFSNDNNQSDLFSMALHPFRKYQKSQIEQPVEEATLTARSHRSSLDPCALERPALVFFIFVINFS